MWMWKVIMSQCFYASLIIMLICDAVGLHFLKKTYAKTNKSLDKLHYYWTDANKMAYLIGYVGMFRFFQLNSSKIKIILSIQAVDLWICMTSLLLGFYERLGL